MIYHLNIVSAEKKIFYGMVKKIQVSGSEGELGIFAGHTALLTSIKPGIINITSDTEEIEYIYISGGILEVQPKIVTILADTAIRCVDIDQNKALEAKKNAEKQIDVNGYNDINKYKEISIELSKAIAKLRVIELTRKIKRIR